jgi:hypothetical protein
VGKCKLHRSIEVRVVRTKLRFLITSLHFLQGQEDTPAESRCVSARDPSDSVCGFQRVSETTGGVSYRLHKVLVIHLTIGAPYVDLYASRSARRPRDQLINQCAV